MFLSTPTVRGLRKHGGGARGGEQRGALGERRGGGARGGPLRQRRWGSTGINRSAYRVKPSCLSSETVLPIKLNRSTYRVKPFYPSSETVLPIK